MCALPQQPPCALALLRQSLQSQQPLLDRRTEELKESWSAKIAFAATLSSIITETARIFEVQYSAALMSKLKRFDLSVADSADTATKRQCIYDALMGDVFAQTDPFLLGITAAMSTNNAKIVESIAMMKGLTDAVCAIVVAVHGKAAMAECETTRMCALFESKLLTPWCSLLLRASKEIREGCAKYLKHKFFECFFEWHSALDSALAKHLSSDEKILRQLRSNTEQFAFEDNTKRYQRDFEQLAMEVRTISVLPKQDRMYRPRTLSTLKLIEQRRTETKLQCPPHKKRKKWLKCTYQLFREDGTPRKQQQHPSRSRKCKRMWQSDGVTKGCANNSHPRGVCQCWKELGFCKKNEKDGTIVAWLEQRYAKKYKLGK